jgi:hypothetical protein
VAICQIYGGFNFNFVFLGHPLLVAVAIAIRYTGYVVRYSVPGSRAQNTEHRALGLWLWGCRGWVQGAPPKKRRIKIKRQKQKQKQKAESESRSVVGCFYVGCGIAFFWPIWYFVFCKILLRVHDGGVVAHRGNTCATMDVWWLWLLDLVGSSVVFGPAEAITFCSHAVCFVQAHSSHG